MKVILLIELNSTKKKSENGKDHFSIKKKILGSR